jgi:citrate lyase subunit beta / citryl-CoA lyase
LGLRTDQNGRVHTCCERLVIEYEPSHPETAEANDVLQIDDRTFAVVPDAQLFAPFCLRVNGSALGATHQHADAQGHSQQCADHEGERYRKGGGKAYEGETGEGDDGGTQILHDLYPFSTTKVISIHLQCKGLSPNCHLARIGKDCQNPSMNRARTDFRDRHPLRLRRSVLTIPAVNTKALAKVTELDCDAVIFDLEDSVAPEKKVEARRNLKEFLGQASLGWRERIIRINDVDSPYVIEDMQLVLALAPDAVLLPKVEEPAVVQGAADWLAEADATESLRIWAMIETPRGVLNAAAIASSGRTADSRLDAFVVGLNDLRKATRIPAERGRGYLVPYMMQVVLAARAYGLDVIDSVSNDFRDLDAFEAECAQGRSMGFDGKMLIHPSQIGPANDRFGPQPEAVAEALDVLAQFSDPLNSGLNVININGRMIERLHVEEAERLLDMVALIEARKDKPA